MAKIAIIATNRSEHRVVLEAHYVVGLPPQFRKAVGRRHRYRKHEPLGIAHAGRAESRACRRARRNAVIDHNRRVASDLQAFAIAQIMPAAPLRNSESLCAWAKAAGVLSDMRSV